MSHTNPEEENPLMVKLFERVSEVSSKLMADRINEKILALNEFVTELNGIIKKDIEPELLSILNELEEVRQLNLTVNKINMALDFGMILGVTQGRIKKTDEHATEFTIEDAEFLKKIHIDLGNEGSEVDKNKTSEIVYAPNGVTVDERVAFAKAINSSRVLKRSGISFRSDVPITDKLAFAEEYLRITEEILEKNSKEALDVFEEIVQNTLNCSDK